MSRNKPVCWYWYEDEDGEKRHLRSADAEARGLSRCDPPERRRFRGGSACAYVQTPFMHKEEQREVFLKTGRRVDDKNGMNRVFRETGMREAEKGEACYERFDALRESAEGHELDDRHKLGNLDLYGDYARREARGPFNARESFLRNAQKYGLDVSKMKP